MKSIITVFCFFCLFVFSSAAFADFSVSEFVWDNGNTSYFWQTNFVSTQVAKEQAMFDCQREMKSVGQKGPCRERFSGEGPAYIAFFQSENGTVEIAADRNRQSAIDAAYKACSEKWNNCPKTPANVIFDAGSGGVGAKPEDDVAESGTSTTGLRTDDINGRHEQSSTSSERLSAAAMENTGGNTTELPLQPGANRATQQESTNAPVEGWVIHLRRWLTIAVPSLFATLGLWFVLRNWINSSSNERQVYIEKLRRLCFWAAQLLLIFVASLLGEYIAHAHGGLWFGYVFGVAVTWFYLKSKLNRSKGDSPEEWKGAEQPAKASGTFFPAISMTLIYLGLVESIVFFIDLLGWFQPSNGYILDESFFVLGDFMAGNIFTSITSIAIPVAVIVIFKKKMLRNEVHEFILIALIGGTLCQTIILPYQSNNIVDIRLTSSDLDSYKSRYTLINDKVKEDLASELKRLSDDDPFAVCRNALSEEESLPFRFNYAGAVLNPGIGKKEFMELAGFLPFLCDGAGGSIPEAMKAIEDNRVVGNTYSEKLIPILKTIRANGSVKKHIFEPAFTATDDGKLTGHIYADYAGVTKYADLAGVWLGYFNENNKHRHDELIVVDCRLQVARNVASVVYGESGDEADHGSLQIYYESKNKRVEEDELLSFVYETGCAGSPILSNSGKALVFQDGMDAFLKEGDYDTAVKVFTYFAVKGEPEAEFMLGNLYRKKDGASVWEKADDTIAARWLLKAAEHKHKAAQAAIAYMYRNGLGVPQDRLKAILWKKLASLEQGG